MAETKIIPWELKALICSHLLATYNKRYLEYFGMSPYDKRNFLAAAGVTPLDIPDVRKTQRRVAALLGRDPVELFPTKPSHRYKHGSPPHTDREVHAIRRLLGPGSKRSHRHQPPRLPPVPQNSSLGFEDNDDNNKRLEDGDEDDDDDGNEDNLFDTSIFRDNTDPNVFKLPSVFASISPSGVKKRHNRVVPTVSEKTFIDSNLRRHGYYTDRFDSSKSNRHHVSLRHSPSNDSIGTPPSFSKTSSLPALVPRRKRDNYLVSMNMDYPNDNDFDEDNNNYDSDDNGDGIEKEINQRRSRSKPIGESSRDDENGDVDVTSSMIRMMSLESELTRVGSLLIDENFVPMSVTITKLAQDNTENAQLLRGDQTSSTENSKEKSRSSKSKSNKINSSSSNSSSGSSNNSTKEDPEFCSCKEPRPILIPSTTPCPCCLRSGSQHETGCPQKDSGDIRKGEATLACNLCGKSIGNRKRKRPKGASSRKHAGSEFSRNPMTPETAINRFSGSADLHQRRICSSGNGLERDTSDRLSSKNRNGDRSATNDHRVRFDENVETRNISPNGENDEESGLQGNEEESGGHNLSENDEISKNTKISKSKKVFVKRRDLNINSKTGHAVNIPNLGVSVHAMAYDLALKDARVLQTRKKKGRKNQGMQPSETSTSGTIFSYFPLLKRPFSESVATELGLKAQEGKKVKGKNYMKHIFGNVKLGDYYPGGKKWREI